MNILFKFILVIYLLSISTKAQIYVSPYGNDTNPGTFEFPFRTLTKAISLSGPDSLIYMRGGVYDDSITIRLNKSGQNGKHIKIWAYPGEHPIIDFSRQSVSSSSRGIQISHNYWHLKGIEIRNAGDNGIYISSWYNIAENCIIHDCKDTGLQIGGGGSNNQIINCDSYFNADPGEGNADGFAAKLDVGTNNYFYGCRAWQNSDDGWDGYLRGADDVSTVVENCWCFDNGYLKDGRPSNGNGNGYKMGGGDNGNSLNLAHDFIIKNSLAFDNRVKGYDQNNNRGSMTLYNCSAYRNGTNYSISGMINNDEVAAIINCVALGNTGSLSSNVVQQTNSWQSPFIVTNSDFISIDTTGMRAPRKPDGSLPDINFMHLAAGSDLIDAGTYIGLPFTGSAPDLGAFETISVIPVELISFNASISNNSILLTWVTSTEINNRGFEVQKKLNENEFITIGFMNGAGTTTEKIEYHFMDRNVFKGMNIYRLKQVDYSGKFRYSDEIQIDYNRPEEFTLFQNYPNPFNPSTKIIYYLDSPGKVLLEVINTVGEKVIELVNDFQNAGTYELNWNAKSTNNGFLPSGIYIARLTVNDRSTSIKISLMK